MSSVPKLRVARATSHMPDILRFYRDGLGLAVLGQFDNHDGFDGMMLGAPDTPYHFEFTREHGVSAPRAPDKESLLVFYIPEKSNWRNAVERMRSHGFSPVPSHNPYWDKNGLTFEDADGYRVVLQNAGWSA